MPARTSTDFPCSAFEFDSGFNSRRRTHTQPPRSPETLWTHEWVTSTERRNNHSSEPLVNVQESNVPFRALNDIIIFPQLHRPQISSFGHLVHDHDNLTPSLYHSSHLSHLYCVIRVFSQYPHSLPHPIIRGPVPHRMLYQHEIQSLGNPVHYSATD